MTTPRALLSYESWQVRSRPRLRSGLVYSIVSPLLFLLGMGGGFGALVRTPDALGGVPYAEFVAPGLLAASAFQTAINEATWPVRAAVRTDRSYWAMLATPLDVTDVFHGHLLHMAVRVVLSSVMFAAVAASLGFLPVRSAAVAVPAAVLTGVAVAAVTAAWAVERRSDAAFALLYRVGVMPMFLFSGAFFPIESLPGPLASVARISPLYHATQLCRGAALSRLEAVPALVHVAVLVALLVAGLQYGRRSYRRVLTR